MATAPFNKYVEVARFIKKYKAEPVYLKSYSRDFIFGMIDFFGIPNEADCENCSVVDWVYEADLSEYDKDVDPSYLKQVAAFEIGPTKRKICKTC